MGRIMCPHGVHVGTCRCPKDMPGAGKCPPECREKETKETEKTNAERDEDPRA